MSKMTFKFTTSFDTTVVVDVEAARASIDDLRKAAASNLLETLPVKQKAFTLLVLHAADRSEEEGIAELIRFNIRTALNELVQDELTHSETNVTLRSSPVKVVCNGLQVPAVPTNVQM